MTFVYRVSKYNRDKKYKLFLKEFNINKEMRTLDVGYSEIEYSESDN